MKNKNFKDKRGNNMKFFEKELAYDVGFGEVSEIFATTNKAGTIRAFHWQGKGQTSQQKIVKPMCGLFNLRVIDPVKKVIYVYDYIDSDHDPIFVPEGSMLGYLALVDDSTMLYIADNEFIAKENYGISPFSYNMDWNAPEGLEFIISDRDLESKEVTESYEGEFEIIKMK